MSFRKDLEQKLASFHRKGDIARFVHYEQVVPGVLAQGPGKGFVPAIFQKFVDEIAGRGVEIRGSAQASGFRNPGRSSGAEIRASLDLVRRVSTPFGFCMPTSGRSG